MTTIQLGREMKALGEGICREGVTAVNLEGLGGEWGTEYNQNIKTQKPDYCS